MVISLEVGTTQNVPVKTGSNVDQKDELAITWNFAKKFENRFLIFVPVKCDLPSSENKREAELISVDWSSNALEWTLARIEHTGEGLDRLFK